VLRYVIDLLSAEEETGDGSAGAAKNELNVLLRDPEDEELPENEDEGPSIEGEVADGRRVP
jgi:hypothetical protein